MRLSQSRLRSILEELQKEDLLDFHSIESFNKCLISQGLDFQVVYFELGFPYNASLFYIQNVADLPRPTSELKTPVVVCTEPVFVTSKNEKMLTWENFSVHCIILFISLWWPLFGCVKTAYADFNNEGNLGPVEKFNKNSHQKAKQEIEEAFRKEREKQRIEESNIKERRQKMKGILSESLDPVSQKLKSKRKSEDLAESIANPEPSLNKEIKNELGSLKQMMIEDWALDLLGLDHKSSKILPGVEAFEQPLSRKPPRVANVFLGSDLEMRRRVLALNGVSQSYEEWWKGSSGRRELPLVPSKVLTPNHYYSRPHLSKKIKHLKLLCELYGLPYDDSWSIDEKIDRYIEITENYVVSSPNVFIRKDGSRSHQENAEHYLDRQTQAGASYTYHPDDPSQAKYLITCCPVPANETKNITNLNLNGNVGQSPQWHEQRRNFLRDLKFQMERARSLKTKFYQELSPEAKMSGSQRRAAQEIADECFGSCKQLSDENRKLLLRAIEFDKANDEFRMEFGYTEELWQGEFDTKDPKGNRINYPFVD